MVGQLTLPKRFATTAKVEWTNEWGVGWFELPADQVTISYTLGNAIGRASFLLRAGALRHVIAQGNANNQNVFEVDIYQFAALANTWVRITGYVQDGQPVTWIGRILDSAEDVAGSNNGDLRIECYDVRWLMTRKQITTSIIDGPSTINRALPFNELRSGTIWGNQHGTNELFTDDVTDRTEWTVGSAVRYLLANFAPDDVLTWQLAANGVTDVLDETTVLVTQPHGKTLYQLINELMPRNRGLSWTLEVNEANSTATIVPVSMTQTAITLPSSTVIPASTDQVSLTTAVNRDMNVQLTYSAQNRYDAVRVEGARKLAVGTFQIGTDAYDLAENWNSSSRTAYINGAGAVAAADEKALDEQARRTPPLSYVYCTFNLPANWTGKCKGNTKLFVNHDVNGDPLSTISDYWLPGLRFERKLPLLESYDYSDPTSPTLVTGFSDTAQFRDIFATIEYESKRYDVASLPRSNEKKPLPFSMNVTTFEHQPTVHIRCSAPPHVIGGASFTNSTDNPGDHPQQLDYLTLEITAAMQMDEHISYTYPETPTASNDVLQTHVIRIGDRAQWIYIADGTTVGVDKDGTLIETDGDAVLRNDMPLLKDIARQAYLWYGTERRAVDMQLNQIVQYVRPGTLITNVVTESQTIAVNTTVSFVEYDFRTGSQRINTAFAEIDFEVA